MAFDSIEVTPVQLITGVRTIQGWAAGTPADSEDTLRFAKLTGVCPMIETYPLEKAAEAYAHDERQRTVPRRPDDVKLATGARALLNGGKTMHLCSLPPRTQCLWVSRLALVVPVMLVPFQLLAHAQGKEPDAHYEALSADWCELGHRAQSHWTEAHFSYYAKEVRDIQPVWRDIGSVSCRHHNQEAEAHEHQAQCKFRRIGRLAAPQPDPQPRKHRREQQHKSGLHKLKPARRIEEVLSVMKSEQREQVPICASFGK